MSTEILLELWIEGYVGAIVENQVVLHLSTSWLTDVVVVERIAVRAYTTFRRSEGVLSDDGFKGVCR